MLKFMKKIPGGLLLIPMLISALVNTFAPGFWGQFGGITGALLTAQGTSYIVGLICFCSATMLDIKSLGKVLKKQGVLLGVKIILCFAFSMLFMQVFGLNGVWGISAIAFTVAICSLNPSMYLALVSDYGEESDKAAFGLTGLLCVPAFPILVISVTQGGAIDWMPIISTVIPIALGLIIGNLDKDMVKMFSSVLGPLTPFMGWVFGAGINLFDAVKAGPQGILLTLVFYLLMLPVTLLVETKLLKESGIATLGITSIAGLSVSIPSILAFANPALTPYVAAGTAQIAFGVVISSITTPILAQKLAKKKGLVKP
ncbi:MAG: 2-keto-3-deoxygluconate permease [Christensenellales bacterium]|jgi:2-keto-3-deoxygluconate permease